MKLDNKKNKKNRRSQPRKNKLNKFAQQLIPACPPSDVMAEIKISNMDTTNNFTAPNYSKSEILNFSRPPMPRYVIFFR